MITSDKSHFLAAIKENFEQIYNQEIYEFEFALYQAYLIENDDSIVLYLMIGECQDFSGTIEYDDETSIDREIAKTLTSLFHLKKYQLSVNDHKKISVKFYQDTWENENLLDRLLQNGIDITEELQTLLEV